MSYAIETKKRKFDRILESLSEGITNRPPNSLTNTATTSQKTSTSIESFDSSKRRRITPQSLSTPSTISLVDHYLPSDREAFLLRLETFRDVTKWHIPSTDSISALAWAKRGWVCSQNDVDTVVCRSCRQRLRVDLESTRADDSAVDESGDVEDEDDFIMGHEIYQGMIKRYSEMIITAHGEKCPWRQRGCDDSIQRISGLLNSSSVLVSVRDRYNDLSQNSSPMPKVVLENGQDDNLHTYYVEDENSFKIAVCGWKRKGEDVIECSNCFRTLGLWLYRGDKPTIDALDPVGSHLDYCPWISAQAQDTEYTFAHTDSEMTRKEKLPGWRLVAIVVANDRSKRQHSSAPAVSAVDPEDSRPTSTSSEQREKRTKDLLRRMKEIRKPFNVKSLLKRREKVKA